MGLLRPLQVEDVSNRRPGLLAGQMPDLVPGVAQSPDDVLVHLARSGSLPAREELFRRHFDVAYRVAFRLLGRHQDAEDAVQDGFVKAVRHLTDFDGRSEFRTWLLRVVSNAALDLGRQRKRRQSIPLHPSRDHQHHGIDPTTPPEQSLQLEREDLSRLIHSAINRLNPNIRSTFVLFAEAGLSYKEIADCQNVPIGTVMSRLHFARQKLQAWLEPDLETRPSPRTETPSANGNFHPRTGAARCDVPT